MKLKNRDILTIQRLEEYFVNQSIQNNIYKNGDLIQFIDYKLDDIPLIISIPALFMPASDLNSFLPGSASFSYQQCYLNIDGCSDKEQAQSDMNNHLSEIEGQWQQKLEPIEMDNFQIFSYRTIAAQGNTFYALGLKELDNYFILTSMTCPNKDSALWFEVMKKIMVSMRMV